jgi:hypothetical protein
VCAPAARPGLEKHEKMTIVGAGAVIDGAAVQFLDAAVVSPFTPGGPTQLFRFKAVAVGSAVVRFQHTGAGPTIVDTLVVR